MSDERLVRIAAGAFNGLGLRDSYWTPRWQRYLECVADGTPEMAVLTPVARTVAALRPVIERDALERAAAELEAASATGVGSETSIRAMTYRRAAARIRALIPKETSDG